MTAASGLFFLVTWLPLVGLDAAQELSSEGRKPREGNIIATFGSSVAWGFGSDYENPMDFRNGYAHRLGRLLRPRGWVVVTQLSMPGDTTERLLRRIDEDLLDLADYAIIGLSLENEGIRERNPDAIFKQYAGNLEKIIAKCRKHDITPIIGLCYPNNHFAEKHHQYIKDMNLLINTWDVPSINFLGTADNGTGKWAKGYNLEADHPNNKGYEELFYAIAPSLFDALKAQKPPPIIERASGFTAIKAEDGTSPFTFTPSDTIHSFGMAFTVRSASSGTIAVIEGATSKATLAITEDMELAYVSTKGETIKSASLGPKRKWHHVAISHRHANGETLLFVNGEQVGVVQECFAPLRFVLGGPGDEGTAAAPQKADYRDWMVYRASLNADEVTVLKKGKLLQASLEVYAPLRDESPQRGDTLVNLAQSLSEVHYFGTP